MSTIDNTSYLFHETLQSIKSNRISNIIAIMTISIALSIFGLFFILLINFNSIIDSFEERLNVVLYLNDGTAENDLERIRGFLASQKEVETFSYLSKEKALEGFKKRMGDNRGILEGLEINPLPSSFVVKFKKDFKDPSIVKGFVKKARGLKGIEDVGYGQEWIEKFEIFTDLAQMITFVIGGLLGLAGILIIYNTIKLTVYSRQEEIQIMSLVGATRGFIKGPFVLIGMIQGVLGSLLSLLILWVLYKTFILKITAPIGNILGLGLKQISFINTSQMLVYIVISFIIGIIGSTLAVGRVLKV